MKTLQLLSAGNVIRRHNGSARQELSFFIWVENLAFEKTVEVHWTGEDGRRNVTSARFVAATGAGGEMWCAGVARDATDDHDDSLPGDVAFFLYARIGPREFWDNDGGRSFVINADSGVRLADGVPLLHLDFDPELRLGQTFVPITVAAQVSGSPRRMFVRWTTDRWRTATETPCVFWRKHWHSKHASGARNPNQYGTQMWVGHLGIGDVYRADYAVGCETAFGTWWDNNFGQNYTSRRPPLRVLTLNLHCNQEEDQDAKFSVIAQAIRDLGIDLVCLQEVAEPWNDGRGDAALLTANTIRQRIGRPFHLHYDWSHQGFGQYRESCAILSRYEFERVDATYVSDRRDPLDIHSRKAVLAQINVPYIGRINLVSTHLSWWHAGFGVQFGALKRWLAEQATADTAATLVCGDFNVPFGSVGYALAVENGDFVDQALAASISSGSVPNFIRDAGRIDYVFLRRGDRLVPTATRRLFTNEAYGRVSDHPGYVVEFEPA